MMNVRRFCELALTAALLVGLASGCAGTGLYSAGRLPYGEGTKVAEHDPFAGASEGKRTASAVGSAAKTPTAPARNAEVAQTNWNQGQSAAPNGENYAAPPGPDSQWRREEAPENMHQVAYAQAPAAQSSGYEAASYDGANSQATPGNPFAATTAPQGTYADAGEFQQMSYAAPAESNPFAEVQGQSATATSPQRQAAIGYASPQSNASVQPPAEEEFLMPIR